MGFRYVQNSLRFPENVSSRKLIDTKHHLPPTERPFVAPDFEPINDVELYNASHDSAVQTCGATGIH